MNKKLVKNPDYTSYNAAWNSAYHDYDENAVDITRKLGKQPKKYAELNCQAQVANLAHQNRIAIDCPFAVKYYDALMNGEPFPSSWVDLGVSAETGNVISLPEDDYFGAGR